MFVLTKMSLKIWIFIKLLRISSSHCKSTNFKNSSFLTFYNENKSQMRPWKRRNRLNSNSWVTSQLLGLKAKTPRSVDLVTLTCLDGTLLLQHQASDCCECFIDQNLAAWPRFSIFHLEKNEHICLRFVSQTSEEDDLGCLSSRATVQTSANCKVSPYKMAA